MRSDLWSMSVERRFQSIRRTLQLGNAPLSFARNGARRSLATNQISSGGYPAVIHRISAFPTFSLPFFHEVLQILPCFSFWAKNRIYIPDILFFAFNTIFHLNLFLSVLASRCPDTVPILLTFFFL